MLRLNCRLLIIFIYFCFYNSMFTDQVHGQTTGNDEPNVSVNSFANCDFESFSEDEITGADNNISDKSFAGCNIPVGAENDNMTHYIRKSLDSPAGILAVQIPERSWPDSHRVRRELSPEIAIKYPGGNYKPRKVKNITWGVGEKLTFSIDYGFIHAGTATLEVKGTEQVNGSLSYHIESVARSSGFISKFYKVRDRVSSYIDREGIFSRRFEKSLREGVYKSDRFIDFYQDRLIALNTLKKYAVTEIPIYVQDILSCLYALRTFNLEVGKDEVFNVYADGKVYALKVIVHKIEKIKVPAGVFECFVVEPILKSEGLFRQKGKLKVWLTKDEHKLPVKMTSKVIIGSIGSNLEKYSLGKIH